MPFWWGLGRCIVVGHQLSPSVTKHELSSCETTLMITLNLGYEMALIPTIKYQSMSLALLHLWSTSMLLDFYISVVGFWRVIFKNLGVRWVSNFGGTQKMWLRDEECCNCWRPTTWQKCLPLLHLESNVHKCQHLRPWEIGLHIHQARVGWYRPIHNIFLFVATRIMFNIIMVKPNPTLHIIGKTIKSSLSICILEKGCHVC